LAHDVLILGVNTRAAAFSAIRCGLRPRCADYFADRDLAAVCPVDRIDPRHGARQFKDLADKLAPSPWFYTGGFENHPEWVETISRRHTLWGIGAPAIRRVRDPLHVADVLARHGIPCPAVRRDSRGLPRDESWLKKPLRSGGGRGIEPLTVQNDGGSRAHYFQERIDGLSFSALFVGETTRARLIGATRQLIGGTGSAFTYRGSIGPWRINKLLAGRLEELGNAIALGFGLAGWFGVDFVLNDGVPWPVEINPRYTASVELHELAWRRSLFEAHRRACDGAAGAVDPPVDVAGLPPRIIAKWILYASQRMVVPGIVPHENDAKDVFAVESIADVPYPDSCVNPGEPVMTLVAVGTDLAECRSRMIRLEKHWTTRLGIVDELLTTVAF
jgi:predicted ATP-grasp superfamily ATP-dependent carboligase